MVTTVIGSRFITYAYDRLNRLATVSEGSTQTTYTYNTLGSRSQTTTRLNGALVTTTAYAYNIAGLPTSVVNYGSDNLIVSSFSYTYRGDGNIATETDHNNVTTAYTYDLLGRLVSEVGGYSRYYSYDVSGNRTQAIVDTSTTISYTYDSDGRLVSEISNNGSSLLTTSYAYDSNGSLISENDGDVTNYAYDVWGNMISAGSASYAYNAQGLRISKTVSGVTDNFVLVGGDVWKDSESTYLRGLELISSDDYFYLYNIRGDVIQLLNYSGEVVKTYDYDAYGNELSRDLADENPFRYCGEYYDVETGFVYLRARYYDPSVGRFTSVDPAKHGTNWYVYCGNNPVIYIDRNGKVAETVFDVISVISSIAEVCINPTDLWAWAGLAGDIVDLIPFATGVGETIRGIKLIVKASDAADAVVDAVRTADRVMDATDDLVDAVRTADKVADAVDDLHDASKTVENVSEGFEIVIKEGADADALKQIDNLSKGYDNQRQFVKDFGKAGENKQWHHIVEQNQIRNSGFDPNKIYTKANTIALDNDTHRLVSSYYSSIHPDTNGLTFRKWLAGQPYAVQYQEGLRVLEKFGVTVK